MYYGASLFTSINPSFCSWVLLFLNLYDPKASVEPSQGCTETNNKVCQIFNEVGGAVRRESVEELENLLNLLQKRLLDITSEIYCFFFQKSLSFLGSRVCRSPRKTITN